MESNHDDIIMHFHDLTGIDDLDKCRTILINHEWNLEHAINTVLTEDNLAQGFNANNIHSNMNSFSPSTQLMNNISPINSHSVRPYPQSPSFINLIYNLFHLSSPMTPINSNGIRWHHWAFNLVTFPLRIMYYTIMTFLQFFTSMLQFSALTESQHPEVEVSKFISNFESEYGANHPTFYLSSYGKALNDAKGRIKFLLVYLHDASHPDTPPFCRRILCSPDLVAYIDGTVHATSTTSSATTSTGTQGTPSTGWMMWACDAKSSEGKKVARALSLFASTPGSGHAPHLAVLGLKSSAFVDSDGNWLPFTPSNLTAPRPRPRMTILGRFRGLDSIAGPGLARQLRQGSPSTGSPIDPDGTAQRVRQHLIQQLTTLAANNQQGTQMALEERMVREHTKTLRQQQDEAYKESLKADKQKIEQKRLEIQHKRKLELEVQFKKRKDLLTKEAMANLKIDLANRIQPEPESGQPSNDTIKVIIKLPKGTRLERTFCPQSTLQDLFYYVFCHPDSPSNFTLATHYPRKVLPCELEGTYKERLRRVLESALIAENEEFGNFLTRSSPGKTADNDTQSASGGKVLGTTFREFGLENNTVLYVQDIDDDED